MADLTPTERAVASLRTRRAAGYHLTDRERPLLDACRDADQQYPTTGSPREPVIHTSTVRRAAQQATAVTA